MNKKTVIGILLLLSVLQPARAQLFSNEAVEGAALGGLFGGLIGGNAAGIGIGAGAGFLLGALATHSPRRETYYYYPPARPPYAVTGAVLGGVAGAAIGASSHGRTAEGLAIGAGAGLLLGAIAEQNARRENLVVAYAPVSVAPNVTAAPAATTPAPSIVPSLGASSSSKPSNMAAANALFGR
jgi:hypothetical protein